MSAPSEVEIEVFRVGSHTDLRGTPVDFTAADADELVAGFDPNVTPAPVVVGHPAIDAPAYGWVAGLRRDGDLIKARLSDVAPEFAQAVREGRYRRVSPSLYQPANPSNPRPGRWSLKHVGFLGAAAPAVKGLKPVHFAEPAEPVATFEFAAADEPAAPPPAQEETTMAETADFAEEHARLEARAAELAQREAELAQREAAIEAARAADARARAVSFAEGLVAQGRLAPAAKAVVAGILETLETMKPLQFAEGEGEKAPAEALRELLSSAVPLVSFAEHAPAGARRARLDPADLGRRARALVEKGEFTNPADAVRHLEAAGA